MEIRATKKSGPAAGVVTGHPLISIFSISPKPSAAVVADQASGGEALQLRHVRNIYRPRAFLLFL
jgi:hypothetical protein